MLPAAADSVGPPTGSVGEPIADPAPVPFRPLQFRELLDLPFGLIQTRLKTLLALAGVAATVAALLTIGVTVLVAAATDESDAGTFWGALLGGLLCAWAMRMFVRGVTVPIVLAAVHGQPPLTWRAALNRLAAQAGPLFAYSIVFTLVALGVLTLGAPLIVTFPMAVIWLAWLRGRRFTTVVVIFEESAAYRPAAARAKLLAAGSEWQTVGIWLYHRFLLALVIALPIFTLWGFLSGIFGTHRWSVTVVLICLAMCVLAFGEVVESATRVVSYVDRRCRREGWDIAVPVEGAR